MDQVSLTFIPALLFVRTGQPVEFRNSDEPLHNINVKRDATKEQAFNIAIPNGATYGHTFKRDGFYSVVCDIHPAMAAAIHLQLQPVHDDRGQQREFPFEDVRLDPIGSQCSGQSTPRPLYRCHGSRRK